MRSLSLLIVGFSFSIFFSSSLQQGSKAPSNLPVTISGVDAAGALDVFESALNDRWSYRRANNADFAGAIAALRRRDAASTSYRVNGLVPSRR